MTQSSPSIPSQSQDADFFPAPPTDLPYDDGEPLETPRHRFAMNLLIDSLDCHWLNRNDYFVGGNMFLYYSAAQLKNKDFRGPDFFAVLGVERIRDRKYWAIWEEGGKYPDAIVELMSDSTADIDKNAKKQLYERTFKTADYFVYDPYDPQSLQGWHLGQDQRYQDIQPDSRGWLWSPTLGLWLGLWEGEIHRESALWLRFYDADGHLVLLPEEAAQRQAEQAQQQAEQAQLRADRARAQADRERQRAERFAEQLRSLGINPEE
jgi:Uma2 family endonuclease